MSGLLKLINVELISQGASEINITLVVKKNMLDNAIKTIHKEFFGQSTTTTSGKEIEKPVKTISFDYFIKPTQKNFASTQLNNVLNLSTGKNGMMSADTNAALIGLGYTKTKGGKLQIKAVVVNSDKIEFAINKSSNNPLQ